MTDEPTKPLVPYTAGNALALQAVVRRPLWALAIVLILIEATIFLTPKVLWLTAPTSQWASISFWNNPVRERVFEDYALHSRRDTGIGPDVRGVSESLQPVTDEARAAYPDMRYDVNNCAFPPTVGNIARSYERHDCDVLRDWMEDAGYYTPTEARPQTFVTATFLHAGLIHLAFNVMALLYLGALPMLRMGIWRFMVFFTLAGIVGALTHFGLRDVLRGSVAPMVGASGAIMACLGVHWRLIYDRRTRMKDWASPTPYTARKQLFKQMIAFLGMDLLFILTAGFISGEAHIGGLIFGFLAGHYFMRSPQAQRTALTGRLKAPILPVVQTPPDQGQPA